MTLVLGKQVKMLLALQLENNAHIVPFSSVHIDSWTDF